MELKPSPLRPFLALAGEPAIPWSLWHESFKTLIAAMGPTDSPDARWRALLIHSLGNEGQHILRTLGPTTTYADCVVLLAGHFAAPQSVMVWRIIFHQRRQRTGQLVHQYVADLQCLASLCKFNALEDEMIQDQFAEHTVDPKLLEKLLMAPDNLSLSKAVDLAFQL